MNRRLKLRLELLSVSAAALAAMNLGAVLDGSTTQSAAPTWTACASKSSDLVNYAT